MAHDRVVQEHGSVVSGSLINDITIQVEIITIVSNTDVIGQEVGVVLVRQHLGEQEENVVVWPLIDDLSVTIEISSPLCPSSIYNGSGTNIPKYVSRHLQYGVIHVTIYNCVPINIIANGGFHAW